MNNDSFCLEHEGNIIHGPTSKHSCAENQKRYSGSHILDSGFNSVQLVLWEQLMADLEWLTIRVANLENTKSN